MIGSKTSGGSMPESARLGMRRATPLAISSGLFGILYGAATISLDISPILAALSCVLVFSGAVQFAVLGMLDEPISYAAIAISSLLICNRLVLMGASMAAHLRERSWVARLLAMLVLTDGAWAATIAEKQCVNRFWFFVSAGLWILAFWVLGTLLGAAVAGGGDRSLIVALKFAGVLFLTLLLLLVIKTTAVGHSPSITAALASMAASLLMPLPFAFLVGVAFGATIAWVRDRGGRDDAD